MNPADFQERCVQVVIKQHSDILNMINCMVMNHVHVVMVQMKREFFMVVVVNGNLMGRQDMQVVSETDQVAMQTDGKNIQAQKQRKDRSDFSGHS